MTGLFNVWKPEGVVSRKVVDDVADALGTPRVGHAGTLDPLATGVLVVCAGQTARLVPYIQQHPKTYEAEFLLGSTSDTDDITGQVTVREGSLLPDLETVLALLPDFVGRIEQVPPKFSAVRVRGRRAHHLARKGRKVEIPSRIVEVYRLELLTFDPPKLRLLIECGSGTYVRSIGRDLGEKLGCGAVMSGLVRTRIGPFTRENSLPLEEVTRDSLLSHSLARLLAVEHLPQHRMTEYELCEVVQGRTFSCPVELVSDLADRAEVALLDPTGCFAALAEYRQETGRLHPDQVFVDREEVLLQNGIPVRRSVQETRPCLDIEAWESPSPHS